MKPSVTIGDPKGPLHILRLMDCSSSTAIKTELNSLKSTDHFWQECLKTFDKWKGRNPDDDQYIRGLRIWHKTTIAKIQHRIASNLLARHILRRPLPESLTIIDCGTGDGTLVLQFLRVLNVPTTIDVKVILIDQCIGCLKISEASLRKTFPLVAISSLRSKIENVNVEPLVNPKSFSLAIFSSVLHELPLVLRTGLIKRWRKHLDIICISEIEGNHDRPSRGTVTYARSVWTFYRRAFDEVMLRRGLAKSKKLMCVRSIIMPEVIRIICNEGASTIDRHFRLRDVRTDLQDVSGIIESKSASSPTGLKAFAALISRRRNS